MEKEDKWLIDAPVGPYHTVAEIEVWIEELRNMPDSPEAAEALDQAEGWLERARGREDAAK